MALLIELGNRAMKEGDWSSARDAFAEAVETEECPEALYGLGEALWWLGDMEGTIRRYEEAYALAKRNGDFAFAAGTALRLGFHSMAHLANEAAAAGWLGRAERLIEEHGIEALRGDRLLMRACCARDAEAGEAWAREAIEIARENGDPDLELCAISQAGAALVEQGRIDEGLALLDEAMAGSLGGEPDRLETVVFAGCNMMTQCARCAALKRAMEWVRAAERFERRYGCPFLYVDCRTVYGSVLAARGDWEAAEAALTEAIELARDAVPAYFAQALGALAELRLAQGRIEEAERLLEGMDGHRPTVPAQAQTYLVRGEAAKAAAEVRRRLDVVGTDQLESIRLLELLGEAEMAQGAPESAVERGRMLVRRGAELQCELATARGERLWGRALAGMGARGGSDGENALEDSETATQGADADEARRHLDAALEVFIGLDMPYEAAQTRLSIAEVVEDDDVAAAEAQTALKTFEKLGAARGADRAAARLRELGVTASRSGRRGLGPLTYREREVLVLLREGLSNPEIGERLFISRKTVEHHVSSILSKLDVKNRAEAAAKAVRWMG